MRHLRVICLGVAVLICVSCDGCAVGCGEEPESIHGNLLR